jgi:hypothetical protein
VVGVVLLGLEIRVLPVPQGQQVMVEVVGEVQLFLTLEFKALLVVEVVVEMLGAILVMLDSKEYQKLLLLPEEMGEMVLPVVEVVEVQVFLMLDSLLQVVEEVEEDLVLVVMPVVLEVRMEGMQEHRHQLQLQQIFKLLKQQIIQLQYLQEVL